MNSSTTNNPPPPPSRSAEELRRSNLNMEKMIKKNVLGASRPGSMKRGLAVVEFFKQQQQQQQQQQQHQHNAFDDEAASGPPPTKRKRDSASPPPPSSSTSSSSSSSMLLQSSSARATTRLAPHPHSSVGSLLSSSPARPSPSASTARTVVGGGPSPGASGAAAMTSPGRHAHPPPRSVGGAMGLPITSPARASTMLHPRTSASPLRQSPSRRGLARPMAEHTVLPPPRATVAPVLNLDQLDTVTPLKPPTLPSKSPFQSFQSKLGGHNRQQSSPSPARPPPAPPRRLPSPAATQRREEAGAKSTPRSASSILVDLSGTPSEPAPEPRVGAAAASSTSTPNDDDRNKKSSTGAEVSMVTAPKPLARSLFKASVATKSLCFSTEGVASSVDVSPDGECIVVAFTDGSVRLYEMDSTVPSDRHGYLLGHLDEESNQSSAGAHLRVKISPDGRYAFVGCRTGPRVMMSIHLHNYRNGKDTGEEEFEQLQKSFHASTRLRGFSDVTSSLSICSRRAYYLLCGLGIGTLNFWHFVEPESHHDGPEWNFLYAISTNSNTILFASFLPDATSNSLQIAARGEGKNVRMWNLAPGEEDSTETKHHQVKDHFDVANTKDVEAFYGHFAYGIAPTGDPFRFRLPSDARTAVERTVFDMEQFDTGGSSKSRRSTIILESIYATDDGEVVVAVSAEGIFYYTKDVADGGFGGTLKIIGRNSSLHAQYRSPMKVYKPAAQSASPQSLQDAVMAVVTNPQSEDDGEEGYLNVDLTETWASRWMVPSRGQDCWVCGVRNVTHWSSPENSQRSHAPKPTSAPMAANAQNTPLSTGRSSRRTRGSDDPPSKRKPPTKKTSTSSQNAVDDATSTTEAVTPSQARSQSRTKSTTVAPVKRLEMVSTPTSHGDEQRDLEEKADPRRENDQLVQELARYKERYNQIVTEWQRRLKGERQMRRLWKQRETEFEEQLQDATAKLEAAQNEVMALKDGHKEAEKKFIFEKLKAEQQSSVKIRYEQLCEQMQERMGALEHQQRLMEQTTRSLLQEVDRHVQHSKQSVNGLVDRQQNECILCKDRPAVTALVPCGHLCFCEEDADVYRRNYRGGDALSCPICQREMISFLRIY